MCKEGNHNWSYGVEESIGRAETARHCLSCNVYEYIIPDGQVSLSGDSLNDGRAEDSTE